MAINKLQLLFGSITGAYCIDAAYCYR